MVSFCQPEGCLSVGPKKNGLRDTATFTFTLTDKDSGKEKYNMAYNQDANDNLLLGDLEKAILV